MKGDHSKIHGREDAVEYYTPAYIIEPVRRVLGSIDYDPASSELANTIVKARQYSGEPESVTLHKPIPREIGAIDAVPYRYVSRGGLSSLWRGRVWLNHPFGRREKACPPAGQCKKATCEKRGYHLANDKPGSYEWISRLVQSYEISKSAKTYTVKAAATITFSNTDTNWFALLMPYPQVYLYGRVNFMIPDGNGGLVESSGSTKGAVITFLGCDLDAIYENFKGMGELKIAYKGRK